ncbi:hypothetical protein HN512_03635 [Candidatus Peregrinibacteria bacterium]|nr:hypothetical protein [Candidatus Peregrinibacteria bacterium]MBT3598904.1 hypothetical protein [Candidatus Peregrinibacteria bacterium]MBT4367313.1 hypothetical protein [Candidatus Peregrinibacteria bacterium]MBT4585802.1 hypothetical protein [Candidatus Peregrinibacteria bacterium]MBT6730699.1 hypothetical protein [Candidatus Peregrinibacteria bacterium]
MKSKNNCRSIVNTISNAYKDHVEHGHPIITSIVVATGIVAFWRGLWGILDIYLYPSNKTASYLLSIGLGVLLLILHDGWRRIKELE